MHQARRAALLLCYDAGWDSECLVGRCPRRKPRNNLANQVSFDRRLGVDERKALSSALSTNSIPTRI